MATEVRVWASAVKTAAQVEAEKKAAEAWQGSASRMPGTEDVCRVPAGLMEALHLSPGDILVFVAESEGRDEEGMHLGWKVQVHKAEGLWMKD